MSLPKIYKTKMCPDHLGHMSSGLPEAVSWAHPQLWQNKLPKLTKTCLRFSGFTILILFEKPEGTFPEGNSDKTNVKFQALLPEGSGSMFIQKNLSVGLLGQFHFYYQEDY